MERQVEDPLLGTLLHRSAGVHDHHRLRDVGDHPEIVRDQDHADVELRLHAVDQLEDLRLDGDVERRRRLVRDQDVGVVDERHGDHRALAHAAGVLMGIVPKPLPRSRDPDRREELDRTLLRLLLRDVLVHLDRFDDLVAHPVHRMETRERVLEDHRELLAADGANRVVVELEKVLALEEDLPRDISRLPVRQAHRRERGDALPGAGLAHNPERLTPVHGEREAVDGLDDPVRGREMDAEVLDLQQDFGHQGACPLPARITSSAPADRGRRTGCPRSRS